MYLIGKRFKNTKTSAVAQSVRAFASHAEGCEVRIPAATDQSSKNKK